MKTLSAEEQYLELLKDVLKNGKYKDDRIMDFKTGSFARTRQVPIEQRATELLHFKLHVSSRTSFYGLPRWISAAKAVTGNDLAAKRNVLFFQNDAVNHT